MKTMRIITMASVLIGFCAGAIIKAYMDNPEAFALMDYFGVLCVIVSMGLFIFGHLKTKNSAGSATRK